MDCQRQHVVRSIQVQNGTFRHLFRERLAMNQVLHNVALSILFAVLGFVLLFAGYRVFDWLTPTDLNDDIFNKGNVAAAVLAGAFVIALAIVIHAAIS